MQPMPGITPADTLRRTRPEWLKKKINLGDTRQLDQLFTALQLNTVCRQAQCPNIGECFKKNIATFLILGDVCTRNCAFCAVKHGVPQPLDPHEPQRLVQAIQQLRLRHVVITSVTRDDLRDGGAGAFAAAIAQIHAQCPGVTVEVLVPDFQGDHEAVAAVLAAKPDVFAHNIETVPSLYPAVRAGAAYRRSLEVLAFARRYPGDFFVKSGIMLGLGETPAEVCAAFDDLRGAGCAFLSVGQYLAPSHLHALVKEYVHPDQFAWYKAQAEARGFTHVESGPYVRSSYCASDYLPQGETTC